MDRFQHDYLQNIDIWTHIISVSFEKALNSLLKVNKTFQTLVEAQYKKLFTESDQNLKIHDLTVLSWLSWDSKILYQSSVTRDQLEELLHGRRRKGRTAPPGLTTFKLAYDCNRWDCASQIFQLLTPYDQGRVLMTEISSNKTFIRYLLEKKTRFIIFEFYNKISAQKISQLCETVDQFPDKLRKHYVNLFLRHLKFDDLDKYEEYKKRYLYNDMDYDYLQNIDIWTHIISFSFEKTLNSLLKVNTTFQTLVEAQYKKLFVESDQNLEYTALNVTVLGWNSNVLFRAFQTCVTRDQIEEILHGRYRKGHTTSPGLSIFKFAFDRNRWDCAHQIFQLLTDYDKGRVLMSEITSNEIFTRYLLEKKTHFVIGAIVDAFTSEKISHLCETVSQFPNKLRRYYVRLFLSFLEIEDRNKYEEYKNRYL